jgi:hypothetical protein
MWFPGFDIDESLRYHIGPGGAAGTGNRGDKAWDPETISAFDPER